jgi:tRNA-splicing ligase RtcB (3'-phosphate/5'-hydroxy nucleic acid ligase)
MMMDINNLKRHSDYQWFIEPKGSMKVPVIIFADKQLLSTMDEKVAQQATNVACLPGIVKASFVMPDGHWGYGFPIGGVAAFDPQQGGVVSAGGVGFDISCGVRTMTTGLQAREIESVKQKLADVLERKIPAGLGSTGKLHLTEKTMDEVLVSGAKWAIDHGFGTKEDLLRIEEHGTMTGAEPEYVSDHAKKRQLDEVGTLGSGNHYMELQKVEQIFDEPVAWAFGLRQGDVVVSVHCGSRGLGHQIGTDFLAKMVNSAKSFGINLPERELACAPLSSSLGQQYLGAMRAGINCALANRQILSHLIREAFSYVLPKANLKLLYDVSHNTCREETHTIEGKPMRLFVHRKGATRSFGPGDQSLPDDLRAFGQPVLIGGTMGTASYILVGTNESLDLSFGSSCHGAGRNMSRNQALKNWQGKEIISQLAQKGIIIRSPSFRGIAEEAPGAYKDVSAVVEAAHQAKLSKKVARLVPMICIKG